MRINFRLVVGIAFTALWFALLLFIVARAHAYDELTVLNFQLEAVVAKRNTARSDYNRGQLLMEYAQMRDRELAGEEQTVRQLIKEAQEKAKAEKTTK